MLSVGGGFTNAGVHGDYFANAALLGSPAFSRQDVRIDFDWGPTLRPGGSIAAGYNSLGHDNFSVRWTGQFIPAFSENYTFTTTSDDGVRVRIKNTASSNWATVIDHWAGHTAVEDSRTVALVAGTVYDVRVEYYQSTGPAVARLAWSSPSTPLEVIDTLTQSGINNLIEYTDIVKGARNSWEPPSGGGPRPAMDADGWPQGDGQYVFQESLNQGLGVDPLMRGKITFSFTGKADVSVWGNVDSGSLTSSYNSSTNTTTGSFTCRDRGINASYFRFNNSHRDGLPDGPAGITNLKLMLPVAPDATTSYSPSVLFLPQVKDALSHFTLMRFQYVANQQLEWGDRTLPSFFNQSGGSTTAPHYGVGSASNNGPSWEYKVMLANETGRDLMISIPTVASGRTPADTASYIYNLANLLKYGSDGVEPYTSPQANPVYPGLNPNLRVYLELENELWNWASVFYTDFANINALVTANADANNADFQIINYDNLSTAKDANGNYVSMGTWRYREIMLRLYQISDIFRSVWGDDAMMTHVRPLYEWQYDNANNTASLALTFADRYFNNGDGQNHVANPMPVNHWLWGGGGASYYGAVNGNGLTTLLPDSDFETPALPAAGYSQAPAGSPWTFTSTAGMAQTGAAVPDIPPAYNGSQMGYVTDDGTISVNVTFPATQTSNIYGVSFKAVNRIPAGTTTADQENLRVYLDDTIDITARTFSQGNGYTPPGYNAGQPWKAQNVFWTWSDYYFTKSFTVAPGSTHKITIKGTKAAGSNQTAFLEDVRVTSVDKIFADGIPGGGEATGQPLGMNIQRTMNVEANWAKAYGLEQLCYESGWSLGGDDGGSWVQLKAKYGDARTRDAQATFMRYFYQSGSAVNVFGTYAQWPSWADYYAEQGLLNVGQYPIIQGIDAMADALPPEPTNGVLVPAIFNSSSAVIASSASSVSGQINGAGGFLAWNVIVPQTGAYSIQLSTTGAGGTLTFLADDRTTLAAGASGGSLSATVTLTKGLHSLKVRSTSATAFTVSQIAVTQPGATAAPSLAAADSDATVSLTWNAVPGAAGYRLAYGTTAAANEHVIDVGPALAYTLIGLTNNQPYYFVVYASNGAGLLSLPSNKKGVTPFAEGQLTNLCTWELKGYRGSEASAPPDNASSRLVAGAVTRGPNLNPQNWQYSGDGSSFAGSKPTHAQNLAQAKSMGEYYQFTVEPAAGYKLSLSALTFRFFLQNHNDPLNHLAMAWSTDGATFTDGPPLSLVNNVLVADFAGVGALQDTLSRVTLRVYVFGNGGYETNGFYSGTGDDIVVAGSVAGVAPPVPAVVAISRSGPSPTRAAAVQFSARFNVPVTGVDPSDFSLTRTGTTTGTVRSVVGSRLDYTVTVDGVSGDGALGLNLLDDDSIVNASGTPLGGPGTHNGDFTGQAYTIDSAAPTATIGAPSSALTTHGPVTFGVVYDDPNFNVATLSAADVTLNRTGTATGTVSVVGSGPTRNIVVGNITGDGALGISIPDATAADLFGDLAGRAGPSSTVVVDNTAPAVYSIVRVASSPTNADRVQFWVTFTEDVAGLTLADFSLSLAGASGTLDSLAGSGTVYMVTVTNVSGDGTLGLNLVDRDTVQDLAGNLLGGAGQGNGSFFLGQTYTIDTTPPWVVSIDRSGLTPTNSTTLKFAVTLSESVSGVDAGDFSAVLTGLPGTVAAVTGNGAHYTVTVNLTGSGTATAGLDLVDNNSIVDAAGNLLGGAALGDGNFTGQVYNVNTALRVLVYWLKPIAGGTADYSVSGSFWGGDQNAADAYTVSVNTLPAGEASINFQLYASIGGGDANATNDSFVSGLLDILNAPDAASPLVGLPNPVTLVAGLDGTNSSGGQVTSDIDGLGGLDLGGALSIGTLPGTGGAWVRPFNSTSGVAGTVLNSYGWTDIPLGTFTYTFGAEGGVAGGQSTQLSTAAVTYTGGGSGKFANMWRQDGTSQKESDGAKVGAGPAVTIVVKSLVSIGSVGRPEGDAPTTEFAFPVTLSVPCAQPVQVTVDTSDGTATVADGDYQALHQVVTFAPGETSKMVTVRVTGNSLLENDETFTVALSNVTGPGASLGASSTATGVVLNDDGTIPLDAGGGSLTIVSDPGDPTGKTADVFFGSSTTPTYVVATAAFSRFHIVGGAGQDQVTLDFSRGVPLPVQGLLFDESEGKMGDSLAWKGTTGQVRVSQAGSPAELQIAADGVPLVETRNVSLYSFALADGPDNELIIDGATVKISQDNAISANTAVTLVRGGELSVGSSWALPRDVAITIGAGATLVLESDLNLAGVAVRAEGQVADPLVSGPTGQPFAVVGRPWRSEMNAWAFGPDMELVRRTASPGQLPWAGGTSGPSARRFLPRNGRGTQEASAAATAAAHDTVLARHQAALFSLDGSWLTLVAHANRHRDRCRAQADEALKLATSSS